MSNKTMEFNFEGINLNVDSFELNSKHSLKLKLNKEVDEQLIERAISDCDILKSILVSNKKDCAEMLKSFFSGDHSQTFKLVENLELTEDSFGKKKGGYLALIVFLAVMLYSSPAGGNSGSKNSSPSGTRRGTT
jgi:hypothetical protein